MREGWKYKKLKDVASLITDGDWIESRHQSESGIRLIQTGNVGNGIFKAKDDKPHYISEDTFLELGCTEIFRGDCLVSRLPEPVGRACIIPEVGCRMITAVDCTIIRFKDCVLPKLFVYYTRSKQYKREIDNSTTGTTRKRISRKNLESVSIPLLPVDEQNKIVAELDLLTEIINKQKQQLKELDTLAQSIFYDMFGNPVDNEKGWKTCRLESIIQVKGRVGWKGYKKEDLRDSGALAIGGGHLTNSGEIDLSEPVYLSMEKYEESPEIMIETGDLILVQRGTIGKVGLVRTDIGQATINPCVLILRPKTINNVYALHFFLNSNMQEHLKTLIRGVAQPMITQQQVNSLCVPIPPSEQQEVFAQRVQAIESQKQSINRSIAESQKLFDYTMDKYFG